MFQFINLKGISKIYTSTALGLMLLLPSLICSASSKASEIILTLNDTRAEINNQSITLQSAPILFKNTTMVPLRVIVEALGATMKWNDSARTIIINFESTEIMLKIDDHEAIVNNKKIELEQPATILNDITMVPLRFIAEYMNREVNFNDRTLQINIKEKSVAEIPRLRLEKPTVDNLTKSLVGRKKLSTVAPPPFSMQSPFTRNQTIEILDLQADKNDHVFLLDLNLNYLDPVYEIKNYDKNKGLSDFLTIDEKFNFEYNDPKRGNSKFMFIDFMPTQLFYDALHDKLYLLGSSKHPGLKSIIYEVHPDIRVVTYQSKNILASNNNFFVTLDGESFNYSVGDNWLVGRNGEQSVSLGVLETKEKQKLTSLVREQTMFVLDWSNKEIFQINHDILKKVATVNLDAILAAATYNGDFYVADNNNKVYRLDTKGNLALYVDITEVSYNKGLYNSEKKEYDDIYKQSIDFIQYRQELDKLSPYEVEARNKIQQEIDQKSIENKFKPEEPRNIQISIMTKFTIDSRGNIIIFDDDILRRINIYQE